MISTLYVEELKATMRGRFAWLGAGVVMLAVGALATVGTQDTWLDGYGVVAYFLVPLAFMPFAAGAVSSPRANRFVESVFTAPVDRRDWFVAKILVLMTAGALYNLALLPMMLVYVHHVGVPPLLKSLLIWAPGLVLSGLAVGTLIGVLFIGQTVAPPIATAMGVLLAYAGLVPLQELLVARGNGTTRTGHVTLLSPGVLLKNALGFSVAAANVPATRRWTWIALVVLVAGAFALAMWVFLRLQGVETWEASRRQRWTLTAAIIALCAFPIVVADTNYDAPAPPRTAAPQVRGVSARGYASLALTPPGGPFPRWCCSPVLNRETSDLGTDEATRRDLLILLPVEVADRVEDLTVRIAGEGGLDVTTDAAAKAAAEQHLEPHTYPADTGPTAPDGHRIVTGWVLRVPIVLTPTKAWDIGGLRYPLAVTGNYRVAGDERPRTLAARAAVDAQVSSAIYEMGAASLPVPLLCFVLAIARWRRTR